MCGFKHMKVKLVTRLRQGKSIVHDSEFFMRTDGSIRLGNMVDYLMKHQNTDEEIFYTDLWKQCCMDCRIFGPRAERAFGGQNMDDEWELPYLPDHEKAGTFDAGFKVKDLKLMNGLPEYRNGGQSLSTF
ncbi:unnamed protein product [Peronospora farinosa]|nr:unnamed protein product [Peronospora farinosa]